MPELPEVAEAAQRAHDAIAGKVIERVTVLHPSQRRALPVHVAKRVAGQQVAGVTRRGKYQLIRLVNGSTLLVHFKLNGDWAHAQKGDSLPAHARIALEISGGESLVLVDSRALCSMTLHAPDEELLEGLGPDAIDPAFDASWLSAQALRRRVPIKVLLLDQRVVAGVGNIYASEALWEARVSPTAVSAALRVQRLERIVDGIRAVMRRAMDGGHRYYGDSPAGAATLRFNVYDREGEPCTRCGSTIRRAVQAGRSTYWCGRCQR